MGRYLVRRLLQALVTLLCVFFLINYVTVLSIQLNGDPARAFFPPDQAPTQQQLEAVRIKYELDDPCLRQPGNPCLHQLTERLTDYSTGDFGLDYHDQPVADSLLRAIPNTLRLFTFTFASWLVIGLTLGVVAAWRRGHPSDYGVRLSTILLGATPAFLLILIYKYVLAAPLRRHFSDTFGSESVPALLFKPSFDPDHPWLSVAIPGLIIGGVGVDFFTRLTRASVLENLQEDHVRTARAKGLRTVHLLVVHVLRNSMIPISTAIGATLAGALAGTVLTEGIMNIHGMGLLIYEASVRKEIPVILAAVTVSAVGIGLVNLCVDLMYAVFDPRIRYE